MKKIELFFCDLELSFLSSYCERNFSYYDEISNWQTFIVGFIGAILSFATIIILIFQNSRQKNEFYAIESKYRNERRLKNIWSKVVALQELASLISFFERIFFAIYNDDIKSMQHLLENEQPEEEISKLGLTVEGLDLNEAEVLFEILKRYQILIHNSSAFISEKNLEKFDLLFDVVFLHYLTTKHFVAAREREMPSPLKNDLSGTLNSLKVICRSNSLKAIEQADKGLFPELRSKIDARLNAKV